MYTGTSPSLPGDAGRSAYWLLPYPEHADPVGLRREGPTLEMFMAAFRVYFVRTCTGVHAPMSPPNAVVRLHLQPADPARALSHYVTRQQSAPARATATGRCVVAAAVPRSSAGMSCVSLLLFNRIFIVMILKPRC